MSGLHISEENSRVKRSMECNIEHRTPGHPQTRITEHTITIATRRGTIPQLQAIHIEIWIVWTFDF